jgi:uncharacterized membrane protein
VNKTRLEAFSDGVVAIIITIMVLEFKVPHGAGLADIEQLWPTFLSYVLSFINVGIYWNNHHHLLHAARAVSGGVLWANLHLLFWLSLMPFTTAWMNESGFNRVPLGLYAVDLFMCGVAYSILNLQLARLAGPSSLLTDRGRLLKGYISLVCYGAAIVFAALDVRLASGVLIVFVACMWFIPDRGIESTFAPNLEDLIEPDGAEHS